MKEGGLHITSLKSVILVSSFTLLLLILSFVITSYIQFREVAVLKERVLRLEDSCFSDVDTVTYGAKREK
ncbi:hypothetical protein ACJMK2_025476, partial [Sinanodonta woodiana]